MSKYLDKRIKGKIDQELFNLRQDLRCDDKCHMAKTSFFTRRMNKIKIKRQLVDWHIDRIEKMSKSKNVNLTDEQKKYINEIIEYKNIKLENGEMALKELIKINQKTMQVSFLYSIMWANINLLEWIVIFSVIAIIALIKSRII